MGVVQLRLRHIFGFVTTSAWLTNQSLFGTTMIKTNTAVKTKGDPTPFYPVIAQWICHHCGCGNINTQPKCTKCTTIRKPIDSKDDYANR